MCEFCDPRPRAGPIDMTMGDNRSFQFFSMAAIDEAMRQTSGAPMFCMPVCAEHQAMIAGGSPSASEDSEEANHDGEGPDGDCEDEYDGT